MNARHIAMVALFAALPAWSQVEPGATGGPPPTDSETEMLTPPPISGMAYPTTFASGERSNYFLAGISVNGGYINNAQPGSATTLGNDATFSILPSIGLTRTTSRQETNLSYSPSILIYARNTPLDTVNQGAGLNYAYRLSEQVSVRVSDSFYRTSDVFDQSYTFSNGGITGTTQSPGATVIAPFAEQTTNFLHGILSYQFGRDGMIGGGGFYSIYDLPNSSSTQGLSNSNGGGGSLFYNRRLLRSQYFGFDYQYSRISSTGNGTAGTSQNSTTTVNSLLPFYSIYFTRNFSISLSGGIERTGTVTAGTSSPDSWSPGISASMGWRNQRANFAASYTHTVTAGGGVFGAYHSDGGSGSFNYQLSRNWEMGLSGMYQDLVTITPQTASYAGGTTISGQASLTRRMGESFDIGFGYERLHEDYSNIAAVSAYPDSNEAYGKISYEFNRPLGR